MNSPDEELRPNAPRNTPSLFGARPEPGVPAGSEGPLHQPSFFARRESLTDGLPSTPLLGTASQPAEVVPSVSGGAGEPELASGESTTSYGGSAAAPEVFVDRGPAVSEAAQSSAVHRLDGDQELRIPVVEEQLEVSTRQQVTGVVQARTRVHERTELVDVPLESVQIETFREPVNRYVTERPETIDTGDELIIPVIEEVLVVERRLLHRENVHVVRQRELRRHREEVVLRSDEVTVERNPI